MLLHNIDRYDKTITVWIYDVTIVIESTASVLHTYVYCNNIVLCIIHVKNY